MSPAQPAAASITRQQQPIDDLCAAAIRAITGEAALHFRGRSLYRGDRALPPFAPHLSPTPQSDDFSSFRGAADAMALRLRFSDAAVHKQLCPPAALPRLLFEMLEQFRVEALAPADMPGLVHNLRHRFEAWSLEFFYSGLTESARGILLYTVAQVCRAKVTAQPVLYASEDAIEATRMAVVPSLGGALAGLRRSRHKQSLYAEHALQIAEKVNAMFIAGEADETRPRGTDAAHDAQDADKPALFNLRMDFEADSDPVFSAANSGQSRLLGESALGYRIFTQEFDTEIDADSLVRAAELIEYRERLDKRIEQQAIQQARLARDLQAVLCAPQRDGWLGGQEEGYIDGRQLSRLITSPEERRLFQIERHTPQPEAALSFLVDCSGSMREHIEAVATLIDVMVRALDQIGVASEVLGFTTRAWQGGRAQRAWQRAGRPPHPGRLNETCHLVFKAYDIPWRRARRAIGAMLKADLFREGVDGEAVRWAAQRLVQKHEGRRLLLVVSDGSPTDGATALANDVHYLDHHLSQVVSQLAAQGEVEVYGVGVGLDLSPYYRHNRAFDLSHSVSNTVLREIVSMLAAGPRHRSWQ